MAEIHRNLPCGQAFPFDASIFLQNRLWPTFEEQELLESADEGTWKKAVQAWGKNNVEPILERMRMPYPYVACLVADGDKMGGTIRKIAMGSNSDEAHFLFSQRLAEFPQAAREIVEKYMSLLVYSGADDVLAFLPLPPPSLVLIS